MAIALPGVAFGQAERGVVATGVVVDSSGGVVPGAAVDLTPAASAPGTEIASRHTTTDSVGNFRFEHVMPGRYVVRAVLDGFDPTTLKLTVGARAPAAVRLTLVVAGVVQSATVTSSSLQADTGASGNLDTIAADQKMLESLPVFDEDYVGMMSRFLDASAIGTNGVAPVPIQDGHGNIVTNAFGEVEYTMTKVSFNEAGLKQVANIAGGQFFRATDTKSLAEIYGDIDKMEKSTVKVKKYQQYRDLFPYCIMSGVGLLIAQLLLSQTVWRKLP